MASNSRETYKTLRPFSISDEMKISLESVLERWTRNREIYLSNGHNLQISLEQCIDLMIRSFEIQFENTFVNGAWFKNRIERVSAICEEIISFEEETKGMGNRCDGILSVVYKENKEKLKCDSIVPIIQDILLTQKSSTLKNITETEQIKMRQPEELKKKIILIDKRWSEKREFELRKIEDLKFRLRESAKILSQKFEEILANTSSIEEHIKKKSEEISKLLLSIRGIEDFCLMASQMMNEFQNQLFPQTVKNSSATLSLTNDEIFNEQRELDLGSEFEEYFEHRQFNQPNI